MPRLTAGSSDESILEYFHDIADAAADALDSNDDWSMSGGHPGQYNVDVVVDDVVVEMLEAAGVSVLSEESGATDFVWPLEGDDLLVIVDPIDGSTNASKGIPWFATALCAVDRDGLRVALVAEQSGSETRFSAIRGGGAVRDGYRIHAAAPVTLAKAVVGVNGVRAGAGGWWQSRTFGAASLDLCLVASGGLDGYVDFDTHGVWDYAASILVCKEAGCAIGEVRQRELIVPSTTERRSPVVASSTELLAQLSAMAAT